MQFFPLTDPLYAIFFERIVESVELLCVFEKKCETRIRKNPSGSPEYATKKSEWSRVCVWRFPMLGIRGPEKSPQQPSSSSLVYEKIAVVDAST